MSLIFFTFSCGSRSTRFFQKNRSSRLYLSFINHQAIILKLIFKKLRSWHLSLSFHGKQMRKQWKECETLFSWTPKSLQVVTAAMKLKDACSLEEKLCQPRQHIYNQIHCFAEKVCLVKVMVFTVVMYGCECWTIKKAEQQRNDGFELWCWRRFLRVLWTAGKSNQSILK